MEIKIDTDSQQAELLQDTVNLIKEINQENDKNQKKLTLSEIEELISKN